MVSKCIPRVLIAGTSSGCGKTTLTCALLELLKRAGKTPSALKCGPDYIDPMFHASVIGVESANLDPFFCGGDTLRYLTSKNSSGDITDGVVAVIEGVMGYYDGTGEDGCENSAYSVARAVKSPVILVVNGKGAAVSALATLLGFINFKTDSGITGVIFNNVAAGTYAKLETLIRRYFDKNIIPLGYIPRLPDDCLLESRHLGLVTAVEVEALRDKLSRTADIISGTIKLKKIMEIAEAAPELAFSPPEIPSLEPVRIAVARDKAFCFYYKDNLSLLREMGAELKFFSPLANEPVPDAAGLYLGGGYPELYADTLSENRAAKESVKQAVLSGVPTIAECGGFMYLGKSIDGKPMCGAIESECENKKKLVRFGYVALTSSTDGLFGEAGTVIRGHEFHYYDSTDNGDGFTAEKTNSSTYPCAVYTDTLYAGYPHLYLYSNIKAAENYYRACLKFKKKRNKNADT